MRSRSYQPCDLLIGYQRAYEEMARIVVQRYPTLQIEGTTYPPPQWRLILAKIVTMLKYLLLVVVITGTNPFPYLGVETPGFITYANENKVSFCLMCFFIGGLIESQLLSTGAFEITLNGMLLSVVDSKTTYFIDIPIWSKLQSNRVPQPQELLSIIGSHMQFPAPGTAAAAAPSSMSFSNNPTPRS
ncbi:unnamed protein product [Mesocestoides corti]|uniref:Selenoprotein T n=1 Tax=Mesocestoides corti TaxID=53468 RepID=A0A0R3U1A3_MESCO|nr:unnamed protein product [Mesocestoides corti]